MRNIQIRHPSLLGDSIRTDVSIAHVKTIARQRDVNEVNK